MFARAREKARQTSCLSNIKQIALGALMYINDYDEVLFGHIQGTRSTNYPPVSGTRYWNVQIYPYVKNAQLFTCPSNASSVLENPEVNDAYFGYGMNYWLTTTPIVSPWPTQEAAETLWFADSNSYLVYPSYYLATYPTDPTYGLNGSARVQLRHNDGVNVAFVDGHSKWFNRQTIEGDAGLEAASTMWWGR